MKIEIIQTKDPLLLAKLNHDVQKLHHEIEPDIFKPYDETQMTALFEKALSSDEITGFVAKVDGVPAGYMLLAHKVSDANGFKYRTETLHIDQICVESAFKGKGIGKCLVDYAKEIARIKGIKRLEMNYWTKNTNSGEFFRSQGFSNYNERLSIEVFEDC
ncbi:GNAT family N-acetyltransferase [Fusibacter bizertensis]